MLIFAPGRLFCLRSDIETHFVEGLLPIVAHTRVVIVLSSAEARVQETESVSRIPLFRWYHVGSVDALKLPTWVEVMSGTGLITY